MRQLSKQLSGHLHNSGVQKHSCGVLFPRFRIQPVERYSPGDEPLEQRFLWGEVQLVDVATGKVVKTCTYHRRFNALSGKFETNSRAAYAAVERHGLNIIERERKLQAAKRLLRYGQPE